MVDAESRKEWVMLDHWDHEGSEDRCVKDIEDDELGHVRFLPVAKLVGHDGQNLFVVVGVMLQELLGEVDRVLVERGI